MTFVGFVVGLLLIVYVVTVKHTVGDIMTFCSAPVIILTNSTSELITEWFPGWSTEHGCSCTATTFIGAQAPLNVSIQFNENDVTTDVTTGNCMLLMEVKTSATETVDWVCPTLTGAEAAALPISFTYPPAPTPTLIRFNLWNPARRRIRLQIKFTGVHSSDILISCSPPLTPSNELLFISPTGALLNKTSLCSLRPIATHAQSLDKRKQQIEAILIGILVPLLLLLLCSIIILLLWLRFGKTKTAWGTQRESRRLFTKLSTSLNTISNTAGYRVQSNISSSCPPNDTLSPSSSANDTLSTVSSRRSGGGQDLSRLSDASHAETFNKGNTTFSGCGDLEAYGMQWTNPDVLRTDKTVGPPHDGMNQSSQYHRDSDKLAYHPLGRKQIDETMEYSV